MTLFYLYGDGPDVLTSAVSSFGVCCPHAMPGLALMKTDNLGAWIFSVQ